MGQRGRVRPSLRDAWLNMRRAATVTDALRSLVLSLGSRARTRGNCCGNYGDPGCCVTTEHAIREGWLRDPHADGPREQ